VLRIDLSLAATVRGTLDRRPPKGAGRFRRFGRVSFGRVSPGPRQLRFASVQGGRRLTPGRYKLSLQIGDLTRTLSFRVR
jgi:hypothetical protein